MNPIQRADPAKRRADALGKANSGLKQFKYTLSVILSIFVGFYFNQYKKIFQQRFKLSDVSYDGLSNSILKFSQFKIALKKLSIVIISMMVFLICKFNKKFRVQSRPNYLPSLFVYIEYIKINSKSIMIKTSTSLILAVLVLSVCSVQVVNTPQNLPIKSEKDLADFFLAKLGQNTGKISEQLKKFIEDNKMSVLNAVDQIAIVLTSNQNVDPNNKDSAFQITQRFVKNIGKNMQKIKTHFLFGKSQEEVQNFIQNNLQGKQVHKISATSDQIANLQKLFASPQRRVLQQVKSQTGTSFSYITKFFFSIGFIIVVLGSFMAIATMENRKDTLLYAKFIADVGR